MIPHLHLTIEDILWAALLATLLAFLILDHPWQKREEVSEDAGARGTQQSGRVAPGTGMGRSASSLTSLRAGERGQAGAPFDWDTAA